MEQGDFNTTNGELTRVSYNIKTIIIIIYILILPWSCW